MDQEYHIEKYFEHKVHRDTSYGKKYIQYWKKHAWQGLK